MASILCLALNSTVAMTYAADDMNMPMDKSAVSKTVQGRGVVISVNKSSGSITLKHEAIPAVAWPAMTMAFEVEDKVKKQLDNLKKGDLVKFKLKQEGKEYLISEIE